MRTGMKSIEIHPQLFQLVLRSDPRNRRGEPRVTTRWGLGRHLDSSARGPASRAARADAHLRSGPGPQFRCLGASFWASKPTEGHSFSWFFYVFLSLFKPFRAVFRLPTTDFRCTTS